MIRSFRLKAGRAPGQEGTEVPAAAVNVFVGPNHSGKSRLLGEISNFLIGSDASPLVLHELKYVALGRDDAETLIRRLTARRDQPPPGPDDEIDLHGGRSASRIMRRGDAIAALMNPDGDKDGLVPIIVSNSSRFMGGEGRVTLRPMPTGDLSKLPSANWYQELFKNIDLLKRARAVLKNAFGKYLVIDPTDVGHLRLKYSDRPPMDDEEEQALTARARAFHAAATPIENMSDGVRAFTRLICELVAGEPQVLLIDEPEAFLHPALSARLGRELAIGGNKRVFVATHSESFVSGCVLSGAPTNIIRLTYQDGLATSRVLPSAQLRKMMRDPLLRSAGVLKALFHSAVVVCEADADRVFYEEINHRLLTAADQRGIQDALFINSQNKQTIRRILEPLRLLGIPAVGVVDIDVLKNGGANWTALLTAIGVPQVEHRGLGDLRSQIKDAIEKTGKNMKTEGGINLLPASEREAAENLLKRLREYGLFVVPNGELECWLPELAVAPGEKTNWLVKTLEAMGEEPSDVNYLRPGVGGVWDFIDDMNRWITSPVRRGISQ